MSEQVVQGTAVEDDVRLENLGYRPQLNRVLGFFENFTVAFTYLSPMVGIYSLFVFGVALAGPAYIWLTFIPLVGMLFVALVFGELGVTFRSPERSTSTPSAPSVRATAGGWAGSTASRCWSRWPRSTPGLSPYVAACRTTGSTQLDPTNHTTILLSLSFSWRSRPRSTSPAPR